MADDYTTKVRAMKTSDIIRSIVSECASEDVIDPDRELRCRVKYGATDGSSEWLSHQEAVRELGRRTRAVAPILAAEIDRRIPIPEGPDDLPTLAARLDEEARVFGEVAERYAEFRHDAAEAFTEAALSGATLARGKATAQGDDVAAQVAKGAERVLRGDHLAPLLEPLHALTEAVMVRTGRHGVTRISLTPEVGLSFGIAPGTSVDVQTPAGRVEVYAERTARLQGIVRLDLTEDRGGE